ncbi:MAG: AraC family transcriptional regulator [Bacteroidota bacterium]
MKVYREISSLTDNDVFLLEERSGSSLDLLQHTHATYELCLLRDFKGMRQVGDHREKVEGSDLILIGPELRHAWQAETEVIPEEAKLLSVQFDADLFGDALFKRNAFFTIRRLLEEAQRGLAFKGDTLADVSQRLLVLRKMQSFGAISAFMEILYTLSVSDERHILASEGYSERATPTRSRRMEAVYQYILDNFTNRVNRTEAASIANLSESAFTHYFRKVAGKSFTRYVIDLRIGYACKLLAETQDTIKEICFSSGFKNVSNFNKLFKKHKACTPVQYRNQYCA